MLGSAAPYLRGRQPTWGAACEIYLVRDAVRPGFSYRQNAPVLDVILQQLPATLILMLSATASRFSSASPPACWPRSSQQHLGQSDFARRVFFFAAPSFWLGIMMTVLFAVKFGWFPVGGMRTIGADHGAFADALDVMHHLVLPARARLFYAATYARVMRASMLEVFRLDFVRTARAKGLSFGRVLLAHVMRNALLPIITLLGLQLAPCWGSVVSRRCSVGPASEACCSTA